MSLKGRVALVTGGAQGIGKAIVRHLAQAGAAVIALDRDDEAAHQTVSQIVSEGLTASAVCADVASSKSVAAAVAPLLKRYGAVDILVNNAGITRDGLLLRMKDADWDAVMSVNLNGTYHCIKVVLPSMVKRRWGRIVNISSIIGAVGNAGQANYAASKGAIVGLTKTLAREYANRCVTVNAVAPGFIETEMTAGLPSATKDALMTQIPMGRLGVPADIAYAVGFLASEEAGYVTGQVFHVNGGMHMAG